MSANHDHLTLKPEEVIEVLQKRYIKVKEKEGIIITKNDIKEEEVFEINEMIINNEIEKFLELFDLVFSEEEEGEEAFSDCEDGLLRDICSKVAERIKTRLEQVNKAELLKFLLNFVKKIFIDKKALMARTRVTARRGPANINFDLRRVAAAKEIANHWRNRVTDSKIKMLLPQGKNVDVKKRGVVIRQMRVRRKSIFPGAVTNNRYG